MVRTISGQPWRKCQCGRWYIATAKTCGNYCKPNA